MKLLPLLAFGLVAVVNAMDKEEAQGMFRDMSQDCKEKEGSTSEDIEEMVKGSYPSTRPGQCTMACMLDQFGIIILEKDKPPVFSKEGYMGMVAMGIGGDEEKMKKVERIAEACEPVSHNDRCDFAMLVAHCMEDQAAKEDLKLDME